MFKKILVATDASPLARRAEEAAIELAAAVHAELVVLHVVADYPLSLFTGSVAADPDDVGRIEGDASERARALVDAVVERAQRQGVPTRGVVAHSDRVADSLLAVARKHECDLVVMASHGHSGIRRMLLGSQAQHVLQHGRTPVLVIR